MIRIKETENQNIQVIYSEDRKVLEKLIWGDFSISGTKGLVKLLGERVVYMYQKEMIKEVLVWKFLGSEGEYSFRTFVKTRELNNRHYTFHFTASDDTVVEKIEVRDSWSKELQEEYWFGIYSNSGNYLSHRIVRHHKLGELYYAPIFPLIAAQNFIMSTLGFKMRIQSLTFYLWMMRLISRRIKPGSPQSRLWKPPSGQTSFEKFSDLNYRG
jgi:hypothetical protein